MQTLDIANDLVALCRADKNMEAVEKYYADDIVSIEGATGSDDMPARMEGIDAIRQKHEWWFGNTEVHDSTVDGPFVAENDDHFAVVFHMDITPKGGERMKMSEVAYYTVRDGKIVEERFYYPPMG